MIILNDVYTLLKERLNTLSEIKKIDWYNEQYQNTEDEKATRYPAVYVEFQEPINWVQNGRQWQHATITVKLHCVLYDIVDSPVRSLEFAQKVFELINSKSLYATDNSQLTSELVRVSSSFPKRYNQLKVVELEFKCEIFDETGMPDVIDPGPVEFIIA